MDIKYQTHNSRSWSEVEAREYGSNLPPMTPSTENTMRVYYDKEERVKTTNLPNKHKEKNLLYHLRELFKSLYNYMAWEIKNK